ncbi:hypothetical protein ACOMHN_061101 [Nucella lapillus]
MTSSEYTPANDTENHTLHFSPSSSSHVVPTSAQKGHVAGGTSGHGVFHFTVGNHSRLSNITSGTTTASTQTGEDGGLSGGVTVLIVGLVIFGAALVFTLIYFKITGKLQRLSMWRSKVTKRRSSTTSSRRPLDVDDHEDEAQREDDLPVAREVAMFTIDDFEPVHNDEYSRPANNEEYFYDEVFGQSMFEDEATNASMRHLYLEDDDIFDDVDTTLSDVIGPRRSGVTASPSSSGRKT